MRSSIKSLLLHLFFAIIISYFLLGTILYIFQDNFLYRPDNQDFFNCKELEYTNKINFNSTRFYYKNNSENLVVFYHGNAGSACDREEIADLFNINNFSFILVEYAGYSNDNRTPTKKLLYNDVRNINEFINSKNFSNIFIVSESIGSAFASYHVSLNKPEKIILISPFDELRNVVASKYPFYPSKYLLNNNYNNYEFLSNYSNEILIIHGELDKVIPNKLSKNLYYSINSTNKKYILLEGKGHNNMYTHKMFNEIIYFLKN